MAGMLRGLAAVQKRDGGENNACRERSASVTGQHQALLDVQREGREVERVSWRQMVRVKVREGDAQL